MSIYEGMSLCQFQRNKFFSTGETRNIEFATIVATVRGLLVNFCANTKDV